MGKRIDVFDVFLLMCSLYGLVLFFQINSSQEGKFIAGNDSYLYPLSKYKCSAYGKVLRKGEAIKDSVPVMYNGKPVICKPGKVLNLKEENQK